MKEWLLKGYVTPADCGGLQKAVDTAKELDICKVVIDRDYTEDQPVVLPGNMYILIENCTLTADLILDGGENWSFCKKWLTLEGGTLKGSLTVFNAAHINITDVQVEGSLSFEYTNWLRVQNVAGTVKVGRGCTNCILQNITAPTVYVCGDHSCGRIVPGSKPEVTNVIVQDSNANVQLGAAEDCGLLNIQADHILGAVKVGCSNKQLPDTQFMNLTFTHIRDGVEVYNPTKHAYIK